MEELVDAGAADTKSLRCLGERQPLNKPQAEHLQRALVGHAAPAVRCGESEAAPAEPAHDLMGDDRAEVGMLHYLDAAAAGQLLDVDDARLVQAIKRGGPEPEPFDTHGF